MHRQYCATVYNETDHFEGAAQGMSENRSDCQNTIATYTKEMKKLYLASLEP